MKGKIVDILDRLWLRSDLECVGRGCVLACITTVLAGLMLVIFINPALAFKFGLIAGFVLGLTMAIEGGTCIYACAWLSVIFASFGLLPWSVPVFVLVVLLVAYMFCLWVYKEDWRYELIRR